MKMSKIYKVRDNTLYLVKNIMPVNTKRAKDFHDLNYLALSVRVDGIKGFSKNIQKLVNVHAKSKFVNTLFKHLWLA